MHLNDTLSGMVSILNPLKYSYSGHVYFLAFPDSAHFSTLRYYERFPKPVRKSLSISRLSLFFWISVILSVNFLAWIKITQCVSQTIETT